MSAPYTVTYRLNAQPGRFAGEISNRPKPTHVGPSTYVHGIDLAYGRSNGLSDDETARRILGIVHHVAPESVEILGMRSLTAERPSR